MIDLFERENDGEKRRDSRESRSQDKGIEDRKKLRRHTFNRIDVSGL